MKAALLHTIGLLIAKAGPGLKPFVPQLQTTFLKCLGDQASLSVCMVNLSQCYALLHDRQCEPVFSSLEALHNLLGIVPDTEWYAAA